MSETTRLTLVSRHYCHLCQEMELALSALLADFPFDLEVLDIDAAPLLEASYDELVPVLLHDGKELCHYFLDVAKVRDYLSEIR